MPLSTKGGQSRRKTSRKDVSGWRGGVKCHPCTHFRFSTREIKDLNGPDRSLKYAASWSVVLKRRSSYPCKNAAAALSSSKPLERYPMRFDGRSWAGKVYINYLDVKNYMIQSHFVVNDSSKRLL